jgi:hypothetical protein
LNVHGFNDVRQIEIHTAEPLVPEPSAFEVELANEKVKSYISPGTDQIPADLIKAGGKTFTVRFINLLFLFGIRRNCLRCGRSQSLYLSIRRAKKQIYITFANYVQNFIQHPALKVNSIHRGNYWGSSMWISMHQMNY